MPRSAKQIPSEIAEALEKADQAILEGRPSGRRGGEGRPRAWWRRPTAAGATRQQLADLLGVSRGSR